MIDATEGFEYGALEDGNQIAQPRATGQSVVSSERQAVSRSLPFPNPRNHAEEIANARHAVDPHNLTGGF